MRVPVSDWRISTRSPSPFASVLDSRPMRNLCPYLLQALIIFVAAPSFASDGPSVSEIRQKYVGHRAYLNLSTFQCWHTIAQVTSIDPVAPEPTTVKTNAMGEVVATYHPDPRIAITVRCPNGTSQTREVIQSFVGSALELQPDPLSATQKELFQSKLAALVGRHVFVRNHTKVYSITSSMEDISTGSEQGKFEMRSDLQFTVKNWRMLEDSQGSTFGLLELSGPQYEYLLVVHPHDEYGNFQPDALITVLSPLSGGCGTADGTTSVASGMRESDVECRWGQPRKINDYGAEGEQWIYGDPGGTQTYVYVKDGSVVDTQVIQP